LERQNRRADQSACVSDEKKLRIESLYLNSQHD
jgi:hypothetical protein